MSIELNYRTSKDKVEILRSLLNIEEEKIPVLIWQNNGNSRTVTRFKIKQISQLNDTVELVPFTEEDLMTCKKMEQSKTIYFRGEKNNIVFKQESFNYDLKKNELSFLIPDLVKLIEKRNLLRFSPKEFKLALSCQIEPTSSNQFNSKIFFTSLVDFSTNGFSVSIDKKYARLFFVDETIKIHSIGKMNHKRCVFGKIRHLTPDLNIKGNLICGVELEVKIPSESLVKIYK